MLHVYLIDLFLILKSSEVGCTVVRMRLCFSPRLNIKSDECYYKTLQNIKCILHFFVPQTCILSSITAKNQSHRSKVQSFTISGSPATRVPASQQWIVQWVEIFSSRCARSVNFFVIAFLFVKSLVKIFPRCARPFLFVKPFCNCF